MGYRGIDTNQGKHTFTYHFMYEEAEMAWYSNGGCHVYRYKRDGGGFICEAKTKELARQIAVEHNWRDMPILALALLEQILSRTYNYEEDNLSDKGREEIKACISGAHEMIKRVKKEIGESENKT